MKNLLAFLIFIPVLAFGQSFQGQTVQVIPKPASPTSYGSTIGTGGSPQVALSANSARKGGFCQNPGSAIEDLYVRTTGTASIGGSSNQADLLPGQSFSFFQGSIVDQSAVSVIAATTGHTFLCTEYH